MEASFWEQRMTLRNYEHRNDLIIPLCLEKRVLHVGCTDWPLETYVNGMHKLLSQSGVKSLDGMDIDKHGIESMRTLLPVGNYFSSLEEASHFEYDVVLVPETIEHSSNIKQFLQELDSIRFNQICITAPCFLWEIHQGGFSYNSDTGEYFERVHPDHDCWFTPYTLYNCIKKYTKWNVNQVCMLHRGHSTAVVAYKGG